MTQLLDEHHVVAWSPHRATRDRFAADLAETLSKFDDTQVCQIDGSRVVDLPTLCAQLAHGIGCDHITPRIDGHHGIVEALRRRPLIDGLRPVKRRFLLWRDAQVFLRHEPATFGRVVDAIEGVAAECEFVGDDVLFLQRGVFIGSAALDVYAEDPDSQFNRWYAEGSETPLWRVITGLNKPSIARWRIGDDVIV